MILANFLLKWNILVTVIRIPYLVLFQQEQLEHLVRTDEVQASTEKKKKKRYEWIHITNMQLLDKLKT